MRLFDTHDAEASSPPQIKALQAVTLEYDACGEWIATFEALLTDCNAEVARFAEHQQIKAARRDEREQLDSVRTADRALSVAAREADCGRFEATLNEDSELSDAARAQELGQLRAECEVLQVQAHAAHEKYAAKLQQDIADTLAIAHQRQSTIVTYESALSMIPPFIRRPMLARAERLISMKVAQ